MKKRIGSKLYDTETSELVAETGLGKLYQKRTRAREWFLLIDNRIEPLTDQEAAALIGEPAYAQRLPDPQDWMIRVDQETHRRISAAADQRGVSMAELLREIARDMV